MDVAGLAELYRSEAQDHLARLSRAVLAIERGEGSGSIDEAFRSAHTLKGMSAAMGYEAVVAVAHGLEHLLDGLRAGTLRGDPEVVDLLLRGVDELERATAAALDGSAGSAKTGEEWVATAASAPDAYDEGVGEAGLYVRVEQKRIDSLMDRAGELIVVRERLVQLARSAGDRELERAASELARQIDELREDALRLRLAPVGELQDRLRRLVRDASRALGKQVEFQLVGGDVEIDRGLLGDVSDLLTHLLRNAIDHGIEPSVEREAVGKPAVGKVTISVRESRDSVVVRVADDGRGVDADRVLAQAVAKGLLSADAPRPSEAALLDLLATPGFSTSTAVTEVSGRGVGLDHVASRLRELGGELRMSSVAGAGATFTLVLPKTLSLTRILMTGCGGEQIAVPLGAVERVEDEGAPAADSEWGGGVTARDAHEIMDLAELCGYPAGARPEAASAHLRETGEGVEADWYADLKPGAAPATLVANPSVGRGYILVLDGGTEEVKVRVDTLSGFQDVVVKRFPLPRGTRDVFAGATILADGRPRLVVDPARLVAQARRYRTTDGGMVNTRRVGA